MGDDQNRPEDPSSRALDVEFQSWLALAIEAVIPRCYERLVEISEPELREQEMEDSSVLGDRYMSRAGQTLGTLFYCWIPPV